MLREFNVADNKNSETAVNNMVGPTKCSKIKCGKILRGDNFSLICEFCSDEFVTLVELRVHLDEHFPVTSTEEEGGSNKKEPSCSSDCEIISSDDEGSQSTTSEGPPNFAGFSLSSLDDYNTSALTRNREQSKMSDHGNTSKPKEKDDSNESYSYPLGKRMRNSLPLVINSNLKDSDDPKNLPVPQRKMLFDCSYCSETFEHEKNRNEHENTHTGRLPQCQKCFQTFDEIKHLTTHQKEHKNDFQCSVCKKQFNKKSLLSYHIRANHLPDGDPQRFFPCLLCGLKLKSHGFLLRHMQSHSTEIYTCDYCRKQFKRKEYIVQHLRTHSGIKKYNCKYCDRPCLNGSNNRSHERICSKRT